MIRAQSASLRIAFHLNFLDQRIVPSVLLVDDDHAQFPMATYTTIQSAVDAASPGDTILVAKGTYPEQVTIPKGDNNLTIRSAVSGAAIIEAPAVMTGTKAIVEVDGAQHVTIRGFTITGPSADVDFGIQVTNGGSATIRNNVITKIRNATLSGVQTGIAIVIGGSNNATGTANIFNNVLTDYQKGGIIVANAGSKASIENNRIVGAGPTDIIAQNGIQISDGAAARIEDNLITNNNYTGADVTAAGIIVADSSNVRIEENRLDANQTGILIEGTALAVRIIENRITNSILDGISLDGANGVYVGDNISTGNGEDGIQIVDTTNATLTGNRLSKNGRDGLHVEGLSSNLKIRENRMWGNVRDDAFDDTVGTGTGGTANHWSRNFFVTSNRPGLR
ncbi:MAG: right-handed parallel beta-helix repeat-containing protein [Gemmataceae bacterium]